MKIIKWILLALLLAGCTGMGSSSVSANPAVTTTDATREPAPEIAPTQAQWSTEPDPLQIEVMRDRTYPGSEITIEQTLDPGTNYNRYVVSYLSDGLKIYALMTEPFGAPPESGWPVILFNHGYIHPPNYRTTENYVTYMDMLARDGYIVFKSDYRGHGDSEGEIIGAGYGSPAYTDDVLNALTSLKNYPGVDPNRIGMWGHSMGGQVTLRAMVVSPDIKAGVIWAGAIAPYPEIIATWGGPGHNEQPSGEEPPEEYRTDSQTFTGWVNGFGGWVSDFIAKYGTYEQNPEFWDTISPNNYLTDLSGPILLQHGTADGMVPLSWSEEFAQEMEAAHMPYEMYTYDGDDHNLTNNYRTAMQTTVAFFDEYVKGTE